MATDTHVIHFKVYILFVSLLLILSACEGKRDTQDKNDTNLTLGITPIELPKPYASTPANVSDGCIVPRMPDKISYRYVYQFSSPNLKTKYAHIIRTRVSEDRKQRVYIEDMTFKQKIPNGTTVSKLKETITEYYTLAKDGLYEDKTKRRNKGLRYIRVADTKSKRWGESVHLPSNKATISSSDGKIKKFSFPNEMVLTFSPYRRNFAKYCKGKSYTVSYTETHQGSDGHVISEPYSETCRVVSVNETLKIKAGIFTAIKLKFISNGHSYTDWLDAKTGLWLYHKGEEGTMEVTAYHIDK